MKCQQLYDLREQTEFCSGTDLSKFFELAVGDPSPTGKTEISKQNALVFVFDKMTNMSIHSPKSYSEVVEIEPNMALERFKFQSCLD